MEKKKLIFFDIDGTILNDKNWIPDSTKEAVRKLRQNGHETFLCSGRCRGFIQNPELLDMGFDGIISGCGTMIEYHGEVHFYYRIPEEVVERTLRTVRRFGFRPILEGREFLYFDEADFQGDFYGARVKAELGEKHLRSIAGEWGNWEISKLSCATDHADRESCFVALEKDYDYLIHNEAVVEMVPKGFDKKTGIAKVCEMLGVDLGDTFAFGDSVNDLGMFDIVGAAVAMGNGCEQAKKAADYITSPLSEDGIWKACRHFQLI